MFSDSPVLSRALAVLLLLLVIAGGWLLVVAPIMDKRASYKADIERSTRLIAEFEARREKVGALKREIAALRTDRTKSGAYFTASSPTLAAARLQSRIKALTQAAGAGLTSSQVLTTDDGKDELQRVTVRAHMVGSIEAVRSVFHTLETGEPHVFLDNVTVSANRARRNYRRRRGKQDAEGLLNVRYEAYGFLWRKNPS